VDGNPVSLTGKSETIMAGLNCGTPSLTAWETVRDKFYAFTSIEDSWAKEAMRVLNKKWNCLRRIRLCGYGCIVGVEKLNNRIFS